MATITYIVKVASGKFTIDDAVAPKLTFRDGDTYVFDQADNSNSGHILQFSATSNNSGSSEYTTGVTKTGTPGSAGAKTTMVTSGSTTDTLYYYSSGGGTHGSEFSNTGFKTSSNYNFLKPIPGSSDTAEKWGPMINHMVDQIDQNIQAQDLDGATDSGTVAVDLDTQSLTVVGSNGITTSGSGQTITVSGEALASQAELDVSLLTLPHIKPGTLYPALKGILYGHPASVGSLSDISDSGHSITNDSYTVGTDDPAVGFGYLKTNATAGAGGSNLTIGDDNDADFQFGTGAFTIEYWVKENDYNYGDHGHFTSSQGAVGWAIQLSGEYLYFTAQGDAFGSAPTSGNKIIARANRSGHVSDGTWYHVAIVRVSTSNLKIYINGTDRTAEADAGGTYGFGWDNTSNDHNLVLGRAYPTADEKHTAGGGFDNIRITKGLAVYTGNFTPPTQSLTKTWSAGTNIAANSTASNVKLLMTSDTPSTYHSGDYGTEQSDGRKYYYTDIQGSKPIKDPRIGAYFGSQRHKAKSLQLLEQESSAYGSKVYSVDGREWMRAVDSPTNSWSERIGSNGEYIWIFSQDLDGTAFMEITGYFNFAKFLGYNTTSSSPDDMQIFVNGGSEVSTVSWTTINDQPLKDRYVDSASVVQLNLGTITTPKITTIKIAMNDSGGASHHARCYAIELIAQDTTSTANKSKIQIPAQNVVSYGKKHSISATATHYDPFNGFVNDTTLFSAKVDTATSLGLGTTTAWGCPWDKGSDDNIRPLNGGRVVKWIASDSTIKTSVTMVPRNAQNIKTLASNEISTASATNAHTINFSDDAVDGSLSEVAKRFHIREFGNGSANAGTGGSFPDISMANATQTVRGYVMDDGLTSFNGNLVKESYGYATYIQTDNGYWTLTFIGTGIAIHTKGYPTASGAVKDYTIAQNLPYGTHVLKCTRDGDATPDWVLDGVALDDVGGATYGEVNEITIFQPKMPPIPQDAVIIADYMLMADFVKQTDAEPTQISKGTRMVSASRDIHYESSGGALGGMDMYVAGSPLGGLRVSANASNTMIATLPFFGTTGLLHAYGTSASLTLGGSAATETHLDNSVDIMGDAMSIAETVTLGTTNIAGTIAAGSNMFAFQVATPIHTSHHYQTFESPYLHELVGGDRNMEQTNLVVSPSGETWDEVTRDTSYIGNICVTTNTDTATTWSTIVIFDEWRGTFQYLNYQNKDFAIAYDRVICLKDGQYRMRFRHRSQGGGETGLFVNGNAVIYSLFGASGSDDETRGLGVDVNLRRGDYIQLQGEYGTVGNKNYHGFQITRL